MTRQTRRTWETAYGEEINIRDMKNSHLLNAIRYVERRARDGMLVMRSGRGGADNPPDYWEEEIYGAEVLRCFPGYKDLIKEMRRRKLEKLPL